jgi:hypothetical protein
VGRRRPDENLTLRLDPDVVMWARIRAFTHGTSLNRVVRALPDQLAERRAEIAERIAGLREVDARLASLEQHLAAGQPRFTRELPMLAGDAGPCCAAAAAVGDVGAGCACCALTTDEPATSPGGTDSGRYGEDG